MMYAIIMAGGVGTRFWPRSRQEKPKQFLSILDSKTMIQSTVERLSPVIDTRNTYFILNEQQKSLLLEQMPDIDHNNIIIEPFGKNTAPCIGLAAVYLRHFDPEAVMAVLPADHIINNKKSFQKALTVAEQVVTDSNGLVTIGIKPDRPSTGYGYIQHNEKVYHLNNVPVYKVKTFAEKPNRETAQLFIESGDFLWNSGMFIWKASTILWEIKTHLPELYSGLEKLEKHIGQKSYPQQLEKFYRQIRSISIDKGVMEKAQNVFVIKSDFGWNDVGSWDEVYKLSSKDKKGNVVAGNGMPFNSANCFISSDDELIAVVGMKDAIVVKSENAILVCPRDKAQDIKDLVESLKRKDMQDYL